MTDEANPAPASTSFCSPGRPCPSCRPSLPAAAPQPLPTGNGQPVLELVIADLRARSAVGEHKYGTVLRTFNGRDADIDAYQEACDELLYRKQGLLEREDLRARVRELEGVVSLVIASRSISKAVMSGFGTEDQAKEADTITENLELALAKFKPSGTSVIEELADAVPGRSIWLEKRGHTFAVVVTTQTGIHTGRRRYRVECQTCGTLVHEATTGPDQNIEYHLREVEGRASLKCVQRSDFHENAQHAFDQLYAGQVCACGAKIIDQNGSVVDKPKGIAP